MENYFTTCKKPLCFSKLLHGLSHSDEVNHHLLSDAQTQVYYRDLLDYFSRIESFLREQNIAPDDCVAFECHNTVAAIVVLLALFDRGQHLLLLPPQGNTLKEPGFKPEVPAFCKAHLTVFSSQQEQAASAEISPENITSLISVDSHVLFDTEAYHRLPLNGQRLLLLRTSGSMGDAKIVRFSHEKLLGNAINCVERFALNTESRVTIAVPVFHLYGLAAGLIPSLLAGASLNVQDNTNILRFMAHERRFKPNIVYLNPTLAIMLLKGRRNSKPFIQTISAGAALPEKVYHDYRERFGPFTNLYGSTELGAAATTIMQHDMQYDKNRPNRLMPMSGVKMTVDSTNNTLHCLHPCGFDGYLNSQGQSLAVETSPYSTGDVAKILEGGEFELLGRQNDSTNRDGFLVRFADIENALLQTGEVEQAIVIHGSKETPRGQKLHAFCIAKKSSSNPITSQTIRQACFSLLPKYAVPDDITLWRTFPLSSSGKIDRQSLQQLITE